jgi:hypothetical protein
VSGCERQKLRKKSAVRYKGIAEDPVVFIREFWYANSLIFGSQFAIPHVFGGFKSTTIPTDRHVFDLIEAENLWRNRERKIIPVVAAVTHLEVVATGGQFDPSAS